MIGSLNGIYGNIFRQQFHLQCIRLVIYAYNSAILNRLVTVDLEEEDITAVLSKLIDDNPIRLEWGISSNTEDRLRNDNVPVARGFSKKSARIDLRFTTINSCQEYKYFMEAKNLKDNDSALKRRYITTGIDNFVSEKYYNGFLAGYLLQGNIAKGISGINTLLAKDNRFQESLVSSNTIDGFTLFKSSHTSCQLDHLFLDFTS